MTEEEIENLNIIINIYIYILKISIWKATHTHLGGGKEKKKIYSDSYRCVLRGNIKRNRISIYIPDSKFISWC